MSKNSPASWPHLRAPVHHKMPENRLFGGAYSTPTAADAAAAGRGLLAF